MSTRPLNLLPPTETLELKNGLSLVPRIKLNLTIFPSSFTVSKPIDEWKIKQALIEFLKTSLSVPITVPEGDLQIRRLKDLKKRKRDGPVAIGSLCIRDLGFICNRGKRDEEEVREEENLKNSEIKFLDWRKYLVQKMDGIELNLQGVKFKLTVAIPASDDFEGMQRAWEESFAFGNRGYSRGGRQGPDTIVLKGVPSRWFAEPRVSSKPSLLVTHTIFSTTFGEMRNLNVAEDDDLGKDGDEDLVSGLYCKIVAQFETYKGFHDALRVLCGRSLEKEGSRLKADYEVTWDKDGFFRNSSVQPHEKGNRVPATEPTHYRNEAPRRHSYTSRYSPDNVPPRRFKE